MSAGPDYFRLACDLSRITAPTCPACRRLPCLCSTWRSECGCVTNHTTAQHIADERDHEAVVCLDCGERPEPLLEFEVADTSPGNRAESGRCRACQESAA